MIRPGGLEPPHGLGLLAGIGFPQADPVVALLVCGVIVKLVWEIVRRTVPVLVDAQAAPSDDIRRAALSVTGVRDAYAIRSRRSQERSFAELTIAVDGSASVVAAHELADAVESRLRETLGIEEISVHVEPG